MKFGAVPISDINNMEINTGSNIGLVLFIGNVVVSDMNVTR